MPEDRRKHGATMEEDAYQVGLRDGRLAALERLHVETEKRLDHHDKRLHMQERITFGLLGAVALIEFMPAIDRIMQ